MDETKVRLRVHLVPVGLEVQRVVEPMKRLHADVGVLLSFSQTDRARHVLPLIAKELNQNRIATESVFCNVWDTSEVVNEIGTIVNAAPQHEYFFNTSTGTRSASIAGIIAGMFWKVLPYYVPVNDQAKPISSEQDFPVSGAPKFIPTFEVPTLELPSVYALEFLVRFGRPAAKKDLLKSLSDNGVIAPRIKPSVSDQALYGQLNSIIGKLETWGFIAITGSGKNLRIAVTDKGIEGHKMFFHLLNPGNPLTVLS